MRRFSANKKIAAGLAALAIMTAVSPMTAQASGWEMGRTGNLTYITLKGWPQENILNRLPQLGLSQDCQQWIQDILSGICPELPTGPETPVEPEIPVEPEEPTEPETPELPSEPDAPVVPELPSQPVEPETPGESEKPLQPQSAYAQQVIELVNAERAREGLSPLVYDAVIEKAALVRAKEIQTSFSHTRPNGTSFTTAMQEAGAAYRTAGENIAWGQKSPQEVVKAWMNSPSHRANIMKAGYGRIGVGYLTNAQGTPYWVQLFAN